MRLAGANACPPDDVGGTYGYVEFLQAMRTYWVTYLRKDGKLVRFVSGFGAQKAAAKRQGLPPEIVGRDRETWPVLSEWTLRLGLDLSGTT